MKKLGIYLKDISLGSWHSSHYSVPIGEIIDNTFLRVYLSGRDKENRSYTSSVVLDTTDNFKLVDISKIPIIKPGENGQFDDSAQWLHGYLQITTISFCIILVGIYLALFRLEILLVLLLRKIMKPNLKFINGPILIEVNLIHVLLPAVVWLR